MRKAFQVYAKCCRVVFVSNFASLTFFSFFNNTLLSHIPRHFFFHFAIVLSSLLLLSSWAVFHVSFFPKFLRFLVWFIPSVSLATNISSLASVCVWDENVCVGGEDRRYTAPSTSFVAGRQREGVWGRWCGQEGTGGEGGGVGRRGNGCTGRGEVRRKVRSLKWGEGGCMENMGGKGTSKGMRK